MTVQNLCSEAAERSGKSADSCTEATSIHGRCTRWLASGLILVVVIGLFFFSLRLAGSRIFQVDECVEAYVARAIATGTAKTTPMGNFGLFELTLARVVGTPERAIDAMLSARFLMIELFWVNILLITLASGEKLLSLRGAAVLLGAATLAPLWDYGFEIRHDNPLLTGLLLMWCVARAKPAGMKSFVVLGALTLIMQFVAFKAFVYTIPICVLALLCLQARQPVPRWKLMVGWLIGSVAALCLVRFIFGSFGLWNGYWHGSTATATTATNGSRLGPGLALGRLLTQTPLLLAVVSAGLVSLVTGLVRFRGQIGEGSEQSSHTSFLRKLLSACEETGRSDTAPEAILLLIALAALLINPTPFPYNLVNLVPYAYLFAVRYVANLAARIPWQRGLAAPALGTVIFTQLIPFSLTTRRHLDWPNWRQETLMRKAEDLTDPAKDPVYDATGMVFSRPIVDVRAFIHSTNIRSLVDGPGPHVRDMLAANPPAVYLPNYRTDALSSEDHEFIRKRYVSLADDFWVLGQVLSSGSDTFEIVHPGRYRISSIAGSDIAGTYPNDLRGAFAAEESGQIDAKLDGVPVTNQVAELSVGRHRIETASDIKAAVVWVGPHLQRIHRLPNRDHRFLFVNWY